MQHSILVIWQQHNSPESMYFDRQLQVIHSSIVITSSHESISRSCLFFVSLYKYSDINVCTSRTISSFAMFPEHIIHFNQITSPSFSSGLSIIWLPGVLMSCIWLGSCAIVIVHANGCCFYALRSGTIDANDLMACIFNMRTCVFDYFIYIALTFSLCRR